MNSRKMIYTRQARWYVALLRSVGGGGRLRAAVVVITPHERRFVEFPAYILPSARREVAVRFVCKMLSQEVWFRIPRDIRCGSRALTSALRDALPLDIPVRTDSRAVRIETARKDFEIRVRRLARCRAWLDADKVCV